MARTALIPALRATHRIDLDDHAWLAGVTRALVRLRRARSGVKAFFYSTDPSVPFTYEPVYDDVPDIDPMDAHPYMTPQSMVYVYASDPRAEYGLDFLREPGTGAISELWRDKLSDARAADFFAFCIPDLGRGMHIAVLDHKPRPATAEQQLMSLALARQLTDQLRLRRLLRDESAEQVVFDSSGRCLHAEGQARGLEAQAHLRQLLQLRDEAKRATERGQGLAGLHLWESVLAGGYSFIDQYDTGGRRRIVAMRTPPEAQALRCLSADEREVVAHALRGEPNKVAALELDIAESTVATMLGRALVKMGLPDRAALMRVYQSLAPHLERSSAET